MCESGQRGGSVCRNTHIRNSWSGHSENMTNPTIKPVKSLHEAYTVLNDSPVSKINEDKVSSPLRKTSVINGNNESSYSTSDDMPLQQLVDREVEKYRKRKKSEMKSKQQPKQRCIDSTSINSPEDESDETSSMDECESDKEVETIILMDGASSDSSESDNSDEEKEQTAVNEPVKWTKQLRQRKRNVLFKGPEPGTIHNYSSSLSELDFFFEKFRKTFLNRITKSTNDYMPIYRNAQRKKRKDPNWYDIHFKEVTEDDIRAYIGIRILMGINQLPQLLDYWSTNPSFKNDRISETMPRRRYLNIHRYFHVNDPLKDPSRMEDKDAAKKILERDPLFKVSPLMEAVRKNSMKRYNLHQQLSVDEAMIKCHGQHSSIVGAPNKPAKRGFKIFVSADAVSGYLLNFQVYIRRKKEVGLTRKVVEHLIEPVYERNHVVFVDKFYTLVPLAQSLLARSTHLCGSFNTGRKFWPNDLKPQKTIRKKEDPVRSLKRGQHMTRQTKDGKMVATVWKDSKHVYNLNTCFDPFANNQDKVLRKQVNDEGKWEKTEYPCPPAIVEFNKFMGGVDRHDHLRSNYTVQRASVRWWTYFVWFAVDIALVNSYIMYRGVHPKTTHQKFQMRVAEQLIGGYSSRVRKPKQTKAVGTIDKEFADSHQLISMLGRTRACRFCSIRKLKTASGLRTPTTSYGCKQCKVSLHRESFLLYHDVATRRDNAEDKSTQTSEPETPVKQATATRTKLETPDTRSGNRKRRLDKSASEPLRKSPRKACVSTEFSHKSPRKSTKKR